MAETIQPKPSMLARIFRDLIAASRRDGLIHRAGLAGGAQLAVVARSGHITATVKRKGVAVGTTELATFRRHGNVPADAELLTPPEQAQRTVDGAIWWYVTFRWEDTE